jgi:hypothetical protein
VDDLERAEAQGLLHCLLFGAGYPWVFVGKPPKASTYSGLAEEPPSDRSEAAAAAAGGSAAAAAAAAAGEVADPSAGGDDGSCCTVDVADAPPNASEASLTAAMCEYLQRPLTGTASAS